MGMKGTNECANRTQHLQVFAHWDLLKSLVLSELSGQVRDQVRPPAGALQVWEGWRNGV